jgi:hypothetical protein
MRNITKAKVGLAALGAITLTAGLVAPAALADYAPGSGDVVGVGSDTVQYAGDFVADGDVLGDLGWNSSGAVNRVVNFDATADANARLAYGAGGVTGTCGPGTGVTVGTGNQNTTHADTPCVLNPTIVLRAGLNPVLRPNGSGAGLNALLNDTTAPFKINYVRRSSPAGATAVASAVTKFGGAGLDSVTIGNDPLAMLTSSTTNAVPLSKAQLNKIYSCTAGFTKWNDPGIGGTSTATIVPIVPQVGSGTRSSFLTDISNPTLGSCVKTAEENDPEAIDASGDPANAIEPMSGGRLNLFKGLLGNNTSNGVGGYFFDPSCAFGVTTAPCPQTLNPNVTLVTTGTPSDGQAVYTNTRPLYIYFRDADVNAAGAFEPGGTLNWVRSLFYNPCSGAGHTTGCTTVGGVTYGPGGRPFVASSGGQSLISAAGILPAYTPAVGGP